MFATPRRWLEEGKRIVVERAPTAFGPVSVAMESHLERGEVIADVSLPIRQTPHRTLMRARVPGGWQVRGAEAGGKTFSVDEQGTVDITALHGKTTIRFQVTRVGVP
jgi:hypothetical protein